MFATFLQVLGIDQTVHIVTNRNRLRRESNCLSTNALLVMLGNLMLTFGQFLTIAKTASLQSTSWYVFPLFHCCALTMYRLDGRYPYLFIGWESQPGSRV